MLDGRLMGQIKKQGVDGNENGVSSPVGMDAAVNAPKIAAGRCASGDQDMAGMCQGPLGGKVSSRALR